MHGERNSEQQQGGERASGERVNGERAAGDRPAGERPPVRFQVTENPGPVMVAASVASQLSLLAS